MFEDVLKSFKTKIQDKMNTLNCLGDKVYVAHTTTETEGGETYTTTTYSLSGSNSAYNELSSWIASLINEISLEGNEVSFPSYDRIPKIVVPSSFIGKPSSPSLNLHMYYAIMSLFIQLEAEPHNGEYTERAEDVNYNLINAYADGTKSFEDYNSSTEEFFKRAEYWNVRGHLYELLPNANDGTFLKRNERLVDDLCSFLDREEAKYISASYKTDDYNLNDENDEGSSTRPYSKAEKYWGIHNDDERDRQQDLEWKIDETLEVIRKDVQYFYSTLIKFVYDYLRLYEEASKYISSGETFISALQKTSTTKGKTLSECYERINVAGFQRYSTDLSKAYEYFVRACERRDASKYKNDDENNLYLRKFYQHEVLTDCNFFSRAEEMLEQIKVLRSRLDI